MQTGFYYAKDNTLGKVPVVVSEGLSLSGNAANAAFHISSSVGREISFYSEYTVMKPDEVQSELRQRRQGLDTLRSVTEQEEVKENIKGLEEEITRLELRMEKYHIPIPSYEPKENKTFVNNPFTNLKW